MPLRQAPKHDYTQLPDVPDWLKDKENRAYEAYAKNPPPGHKPFQEAGFASCIPCSSDHAPVGVRGGDGEPGAPMSAALILADCSLQGDGCSGRQGTAAGRGAR